MPALGIWKGDSVNLTLGVKILWVGVMAYVHPGDGALDYSPCRYGMSKLVFRGPQRSPAGAFCVTLGGTETYGKFVAEPYPTLLEFELEMPVLNLGCVNAGPDAFLQDPAILEIASRAQVAVVQVMGAQNLSNRYYGVHPRRNDRFLSASPLLRAMFREVDFTEFHFTRHMLQTLQAIDANRFESVAEELRASWVRRMQKVLDAVDTHKVLVWISDRAPPHPGAKTDLHHDPILVDAEMLAELKPHASAYVECISSAAARAEGTRGMAFGPAELHAAQELPGPAVHRDVVRALLPVVNALI
jgi:Domain of unknown function (DUF6473)